VAAKLADHGTVEKVSVDGPVSGVGARDTYVYLPPQYFDPARSSQRFPVLYLLHGSPGISVDWLRAGWVDRAMDDLLVKDRIAPFIVVLPDINGGYRRDTECEDIPNGPHVQTYLVHDVVDYVDANYRTISERGARAIGGLSTGGYCAVNLVLRHQDVFSGIVSHSGYDRPDHNVYTGDLFGSDRREERANTPGQYLPTIPLTQPLGVYIDVGMSDGPSRSESTELSKAFERRGVAVTFHDFADESHSWLVWRRNLFSSLPWVSSWFVSTGVSAPAGPGGTAVLAAPTAPTVTGVAAPEPAPTDAELLAPPDPLHIAGQEPAATIERHLPPPLTHTRPRIRVRPPASPSPSPRNATAAHRPTHPAGRSPAKT
jgi:enterochelin esterase-like enzyme